MLHSFNQSCLIMSEFGAVVPGRNAAEPFPCEAITRSVFCGRLVEDKLARFSARGFASYLVDGGARVLRANDAANTTPSLGLAVRAGRLRCQTKSDQIRLESALADAAASSANAAAYVRLSRTPDCANPLVLVAPVAASDLALATLVDVSARVREASRSLDMLSKAFGLTAREAEVGALISTGADIAAVAARLGVAIGTARNYLKTAMQKLEVHSQVELAAFVGELSNLAAA